MPKEKTNKKISKVKSCGFPLPQRRRILAIDPSTRYMGCVVLENSLPKYYAVKTITMSRYSQRKIRRTHKEGISRLHTLAPPSKLPTQQVARIVQSRIDTYRPELLVIEKPHSRWIKRSDLLHKLIGAIKKTAMASGIEIKEYTPEDVRTILCGNPLATKQDIAHVLSHISDVSVLLQFDRINDRYWCHLFDALVLGVAASL